MSQGKPVVLDESTAFALMIDEQRSIEVIRVKGTKGDIVLTVSDPHDVAIVSMSQSKLVELIDGLTTFKK